MTFSSLDYLIGGVAWVSVFVFTATFTYFQSRKFAFLVNKATDFMIDGISKFVAVDQVGTSGLKPTASGDVDDGLLSDEDEFYKSSHSTLVLRFGVGGKLIEMGSSARVSAYVLLRAYEDRVERDLVFVSVAAMRKNGVGRMKLEPFIGSINLTHPVLADDTLKLINPLLVSGGALVAVPAKPPKASAKEETPVAHVPAEAKPDKTVLESDAQPPKPKTMPSWKGKVLDYGIGERALSTDDEDDPENKEPKMIKQYRLVLEIHGAEESIWGQDLHRAITDSGAVKGDMVEVLKTGRKKLENKKTMNLYSIKKLA